MKVVPILTLLALVGSLHLVSAEPVRVRLLKADGTRPIGYIHNSNDKGIQFSLTQQDPNPVGLPHSDVKGVSFEEEGDIIGPAHYAYSRQQYEAAEQLYEKVADDYNFLWGIKREQLGNFASTARYFQIDCLRRLGRYGEIGDALNTDTGKSLEDTIAELHLPNLKLLRLWERVAAEDWDTVESKLNEYETPLAGKQAELFKVTSFRTDLAPSVVAQLSYMRAKLFEARNRKDDALLEYYSAMTLNYGSDAMLTRDAMNAALAIQSGSESLKDSYAEQKDIHSLATVYKNVYNKGEIETLYMEYLKEPAIPEAIKKQMEAAEQEAEQTAEQEAETE